MHFQAATSLEETVYDMNAEGVGVSKLQEWLKHHKPEKEENELKLWFCRNKSII